MTGHAPFAKALRTLRTNRGWSGKALGSLIGCTGSAVQAWERQEALPHAHCLSMVAQVFQVCPQSLWDGRPQALAWEHDPQAQAVRDRLQLQALLRNNPDKTWNYILHAVHIGTNTTTYIRVGNLPFADALRRLMVGPHKDVAAMLGIPSQRMSTLISGRVAVKVDVLSSIAYHYRVSPQDLLAGNIQPMGWPHHRYPKGLRVKALLGGAPLDTLNAIMLGAHV